MTNLQAIDLLKDLEQSLDDYCELNDEGKTAFRMAITALELFGNAEQLPSAQPEKRTEERMETYACDLIDRQAAIDALDKRFDNVPMEQTAEILKLRKDLRELPSVQQERKTGRWVERNPQNSPDCRLIECSECGNAYIVGYDIDYDDWIDGRDFCMRCGADLRGGSNGKST